MGPGVGRGQAFGAGNGGEAVAGQQGDGRGGAGQGDAGAAFGGGAGGERGEVAGEHDGVAHALPGMDQEVAALEGFALPFRPGAGGGGEGREIRREAGVALAPFGILEAAFGVAGEGAAGGAVPGGGGVRGRGPQGGSGSRAGGGRGGLGGGGGSGGGGAGWSGGEGGAECSQVFVEPESAGSGQLYGEQ